MPVPNPCPRMNMYVGHRKRLQEEYQQQFVSMSDFDVLTQRTSERNRVHDGNSEVPYP